MNSRTLLPNALKNYKAIGAEAGYSKEQIKEYKAIIDLFVKVGR